jgi:hypothetical protein
MLRSAQISVRSLIVVLKRLHLADVSMKRDLKWMLALLVVVSG